MIYVATLKEEKEEDILSRGKIQHVQKRDSPHKIIGVAKAF